MVVVLTGGTGGAKLVHGLSLEADPEKLAIICNIADDFVLHGLHISPDLDTITYSLAGLADATKGWGIQDDTFVALEWLGRYGGETWFRLGDKDLAIHITRSALLREGIKLSEVTKRVCKALGIKATILPVSDEQVETRITTARGNLSFQEYFVRDRWADNVMNVSFVGAEKSRPAPGVIKALQEADAIVICPSNPVTSIGPILAVPEVKAAIEKTGAPVVGVSPIIQGAPVNGPAHKLMAAQGLEVSAFGVAGVYADFLDAILIASEDQELKGKIEELGIKAVATSIRMNSLADKRRLAREVLAAAQSL
jgi:LPPG:FO 2-phospho-L-lactate transferase